MANLDNVRRIIKEDYDKKYHDLINQLGFVLNTFMEQTTTEFNGNVDFCNLAQDKITFNMKVDSAGTPVGNDLFRSTVISPSGTHVINAVDTTSSSAFVINQPFITFTVQTDAKVVKVNNITGLKANTTYKLTVIVYN